MSEKNSGADAPVILTFEKDKSGRRIYEVKTAKLPDNVTVMSLDRLTAIAAEYGTPHFRMGGMHYAYLPFHAVAVARDDEAATKPTGGAFVSSSFRFHHIVGVQAAPSIEVRT